MLQLEKCRNVQRKVTQAQGFVLRRTALEILFSWGLTLFQVFALRVSFETKMSVLTGVLEH